MTAGIAEFKRALFEFALCGNTRAMTASAAQPRRRPWYRPSLTVQIMIGLVVGAGIGYFRPDWGNNVYFLREYSLT